MSWKNNRPDDWKEIKEAIKPLHCTNDGDDEEYWHFLDGVEAGADAMLEALKGEGVKCSVGNERDAWALFYKLTPFTKGWLVFIPEEAKGGE